MESLTTLERGRALLLKSAALRKHVGWEPGQICTASHAAHRCEAHGLQLGDHEIPPPDLTEPPGFVKALTYLSEHRHYAEFDYAMDRHLVTLITFVPIFRKVYGSGDSPTRALLAALEALAAKEGE